MTVFQGRISEWQRYLPRRASSSLTFRRLKVGFLRDSGYTHSLFTLTQRVQAGLVRSHLSFLARHETHARGSVLCIASAEASGWASVEDMAMRGKSHAKAKLSSSHAELDAMRHGRSHQGLYIALVPERSDYLWSIQASRTISRRDIA